MAKVGQPIRGAKPPSYGAKVVVRVSEGVAIVQAWPRKRGRSRNPVTIEQNLKFKEANQLAKYAPSDDQWMAIEVAKNSPLYPRDLLLAAMYGRLFETITVDGRRMVSMAVIEDISSDLDLIGSTTHGAILIRDDDLWTGLPPGAVGQVLTSGGGGANPFWGAGGGGAGAYITGFPPGFLPDGQAFATKGNMIATAQAVTVHQMSATITAVVGHTYRGRIWSLDGGNAITALVGDTGALTTLPAGRQTIWVPLLAPAALASGTRFYIAWSRSDGPNNFACPLHAGAGERGYEGFPTDHFVFGANQNNFSRMALANPVVPNVINIGGSGGFSIPLNMSL